MKEGASVVFQRNKYLLPMLSVLGAVIGILIGVFSKKTAIASLCGGVLHPFPAAFSLAWLYKALFTELLPVIVIYLSGFGFLQRPLSGLVLLYRTLLSGFTLTLLYRQIDGTLALYLFVFILLTELLIVGVFLSLARLSALFFRSMLSEYLPSKIKRYTLDYFFFIGLLVLFYFIKGCMMAVLYRTA